MVAGELGRPVLADVDSLEAAVAARRRRSRRGGDDAGGLHRCRAGSARARPGAGGPAGRGARLPGDGRGPVRLPRRVRAAFDAGACAVVVGPRSATPLRSPAALRPSPGGPVARGDEPDGLPRRLPGGAQGAGAAGDTGGAGGLAAAGLGAALRAAAGRALRPGPHDGAHRGRPPGRRRLGVPPARARDLRGRAARGPGRALQLLHRGHARARAGARLGRARPGDHRGHELPRRRARDRPRGAGGAVERLRTADGRPMALERAHLPADRFPGVAEADFEAGSLFECSPATASGCTRRASACWG